MKMWDIFKKNGSEFKVIVIIDCLNNELIFLNISHIIYIYKE